MIAMYGCAPSSGKSSGTTPAISSSAQDTFPVVQQYIPTEYYSCFETTPENLCNAYFSRYYNIADAELKYNGQIFVFKNVKIADSDLKYATDEYMWVNTIIQCYFLKSGSASQLKANEVVDIVGYDSGPNKDYSGTLTFSGCIFLPAGSVEIPAGDSSNFTIPTY